MQAIRSVPGCQACMCKRGISLFLLENFGKRWKFNIHRILIFDYMKMFSQSQLLHLTSNLRILCCCNILLR